MIVFLLSARFFLSSVLNGYSMTEIGGEVTKKMDEHFFAMEAPNP
jgi:hypothetical protein